MDTGVIDFLANHAHLVEPLAQLHHAEWSGMLPWFTHDDALAEFRDHAQSRSFPTTFVAVAGTQLLGSASLIARDLPEEDLPGFGAVTPWLASVLVLPGWRGQGIGGALVEAVVAHARGLGVPRLHLFTEGQEAFYLRSGWSELHRFTLRGAPATVMVRELLPVSEAS
ncbi:GNAT family N-acetyltransferase [Chondromyces crocatus]|uniref:GCN5 family acetyltransferase n=1 Tax=Chondromyces crocatus TaxID=52 RepID=A0A0K1ES98_CHOCO|nr:GNAT family N-acetyltransferase [Chondromyces crocatus]AKT43664.1 GCN5 family acetyltransferase [Chondromyces crocatus]